MSKRTKRIYLSVGCMLLAIMSIFVGYCFTTYWSYFRVVILFLVFGCMLVYLAILGTHNYFSKQKKLLDSHIKFLNDVNSQIISVLLNVIEAKDEYTRGHSIRVAKIAVELGKRCGMSKDEVRDLYYVAVLHDVGKIKIPDRILKKQSELTDEEFSEMQKHTLYGAKMFREFTVIADVSSGMLYHHERYDGSGYPQGLSGDEIPLYARIIAVADAFDTMNTRRCYRTELHKDVIISELKRCSGAQFDPAVVNKMLEYLKEHPDIFNKF